MQQVPTRAVESASRKPVALCRRCLPPNGSQLAVAARLLANLRTAPVISVPAGFRESAGAALGRCWELAGDRKHGVTFGRSDGMLQTRSRV